jgi:hypothetical protein
LIIGGCGGGSDDKPLYTYPDFVKANFMSGCTQGALGGRTDSESQAKAQDACKCALLYLEDRVPTERIPELNRPNPPQDLANVSRAAINACVR